MHGTCTTRCFCYKLRLYITPFLFTGLSCRGIHSGADSGHKRGCYPCSPLVLGNQKTGPYSGGPLSFEPPSKLHGRF